MYPETILPIVAHIPHAGMEIPDVVRDQFLPYPGELWREVAVVTDWRSYRGTGRIFLEYKDTAPVFEFSV
jgi:hypothetical protein